MNTDVPIATLVEGLPNELLYPIFRLVISTKYITLPDFCNFISRNCLEFDPFTNLCSLVIGNSVAVLDGSIYYNLMIEIEQGVQLPHISVHFCESPIFINFIEVLTRFHMKFQKLHIGSPDWFLFSKGPTQSVYQIFINNNFVQSCCKELHINHCGSDVPDSHLGSLCPYSRIVKTLAIRMTHQDLEYLPNFLNVELLGIDDDNWIDDDDGDNITPLKDWINMISGMKIKRKIVISAGDKISQALINFIIETVAKHELIDIKIDSFGYSPALVNTLKPVKDHIRLIWMDLSCFSPYVIDALNSYPCLTQLEVATDYSIYYGYDFPDALNNRNIDTLLLTAQGEPYGQLIPVESTENLKKLKSLEFYTTSRDFSKLKRLKHLDVNFFFFPSDTSTSLILPPNLETMDWAFMEQAPIIEIANRNCLKRLRKVSLRLRRDNCVEPALMLMKCLPTSVTSLSFSSERSVKLNFAPLVNLESLRLSSSSKDKMDLEICEFPKYLRSLSISVCPNTKLVVPGFPNTLLRLDLTCPLEPLSDYNANNLKQLSCLTIQTSGIGYIDLRKIIPDSLLYCSLLLEHEKEKMQSERAKGNKPKCTIELPFQSHPNLKFLLVEQARGFFYEEIEVCFQGEMSQYDKSKLKLATP